MSANIDVSAILNVHREGVICGISVANFARCIEHARSNGLSVEAIIVGDKTDEITRSIIQNIGLENCRVYLVDFGDLSASRNYGVHQSGGIYCTFLDGDDLWGRDWITNCYNYAIQLNRKTVLHSALSLYCGNARHALMHVDSEDAAFDDSYLRVSNYWDSLCFCERKILLEFPYVPNTLKTGFGYEDWHWNCVTLAAGIQHRPCPKTLHVKRSRNGSLMVESQAHDVIPLPNPLTSYERSLRNSHI